MQGLVWSTWAIIICLFALIIGVYNLFPDYKNPEEWERQCACWASVCSTMFCRCSCTTKRSGDTEDDNDNGGHTIKSASERLGSLFALMFSHIDLTPSDLAAAFGLALNRQRVRRRLLNEAAERRKKQDDGDEGYRSPDSNDELLPAGADADVGDVVTGTTMHAMERGESSASTSVHGTMALGGRKKSSFFTNGMGAAGEEFEHAPEEEGDKGIVPAEDLKDAAHFMKYAFAAYGWMLFVYDKNISGVAQLCCGRGCGMWRSKAPAARVPTPSLNREAILQAAEIEESDLLRVREEGQVANVLPYIVVADHSRKSVVVAIRGSMSMEDVVRDLLFEPVDVDAWVLVDDDRSDDGSQRQQQQQRWEDPVPPIRPASPSTRYAAHSGIFEATRATMIDLQHSHILSECLLGPNARFPGYSLVLCGHSLGAGCAFLLSLRLRRFFPHLCCWSFSPPGGLATAELSAGSAEWCTSVVCGKEMIPRLTLATFERARDEMVVCAARCRRSKARLFAGWLTGRVWTDAELFYPLETLPAEPQAWLEGYRASLATTTETREYVKLASKFGPPGRVMYLKQIGHRMAKKNKSINRKKVNGKREYQAVWVDGEVLIDQGLLLSGRMWLDHFPDYALGTLRRLASAAMRSSENEEAVLARGVGVNGAATEEVFQRMRSRASTSRTSS